MQNSEDKPNFRQGDLVRYNSTASTPGKFAGEVGTLTHGDSGWKVRYLGTDKGWDYASSLELVKLQEEVKLREYKIIGADSCTDLANLVNQELRAGFKPIGGVCISGSRLIQAMVKE